MQDCINQVLYKEKRAWMLDEHTPFVMCLIYEVFVFQMFRKLHNSFTDVMCNPFHNPGDRIQSKWVKSFETW